MDRWRQERKRAQTTRSVSFEPLGEFIYIFILRCFDTNLYLLQIYGVNYQRRPKTTHKLYSPPILLQSTLLE